MHELKNRGTVLHVDSQSICDLIFLTGEETCQGPIEIMALNGANSVVNRFFLEKGITIAGAPARKVGCRGSEGLLIRATGLTKRHLSMADS
jgi:hypothetical protein